VEDLKIKFIENDENGVYKLSTPLHSFSCYVIPREHVGAAIAYSDIESNGIYFLINTTQSIHDKRYLYIGETVQGPRRLHDHKQKKNSWDKAVMFLGPKSVFSSDTINEIERIMIEKYSASDLYDLGNRKTSHFDPEDISKKFSEQILKYLSFLSYGLNRTVKHIKEVVIEDKKSVMPTKLPKMDALFSWGIIKKDDIVLIKGNPEKTAIVLDDSNVLYDNRIMSFNQWGLSVTGWKSIQVYTNCYILGQTESLHEQRINKMKELGI
jgi:hypothetical protein